MDNQFRCTYLDCNRYFPTEKAMKRHKAKDEVHDFYCRRCDQDFHDDTTYLYHQITSDRHMSCPICGCEFRSRGGRDRHVELDHPAKQKLNCAGCNSFFESASGLMYHIEHNECSVITSSHFFAQRAERQLARDIRQTISDPTFGSTNFANRSSHELPGSDVPLCDDERAWANVDWRGQAMEDSGNDQSKDNADTVTESMINLSIDDFPHLSTHATLPKGSLPNANSPQNDLIEFKQDFGIERPTGRHSSGSFLQKSKPDTPSGQSQGFENSLLLDDSHSHVEITAGRERLGKQPFLMQDTPNTILTPTSNFNGVSGNLDSQHITTAIRTTVPSPFPNHEHYDRVAERYVCPDYRCKKQFRTQEGWRSHLQSDLHANRSAKCPSCMKTFGSTTALVAHCSSASRRCRIRDSIDYDKVIREITAGMIAAPGYQEDNSIKYTAQRIEDW